MQTKQCRLHEKKTRCSWPDKPYQRRDLGAQALISRVRIVQELAYPQWLYGAKAQAQRSIKFYRSQKAVVQLRGSELFYIIIQFLKAEAEKAQLYSYKCVLIPLYKATQTSLILRTQQQDEQPSLLKTPLHSDHSSAL